MIVNEMNLATAIALVLAFGSCAGLIVSLNRPPAAESCLAAAFLVGVNLNANITDLDPKRAYQLLDVPFRAEWCESSLTIDGEYLLRCQLG
jgi:hypothetical protein